MTPQGPEHEGAPGGPYGGDPYRGDPYGGDPYGEGAYGEEGYVSGAYGEGAYAGDPYGGGAYGQQPYAGTHRADPARPGPGPGETGPAEPAWTEPTHPGPYPGRRQTEEPHTGPYPDRGAPYTPPDDYAAAVHALRDPLTDPLPGTSPSGSAGAPGTPALPEGQQHGSHTSPWFRPHQEPQPSAAADSPQPPRQDQPHPRQPHDPLQDTPQPPHPQQPQQMRQARHARQPQQDRQPPHQPYQEQQPYQQEPRPRPRWAEERGTPPQARDAAPRGAGLPGPSPAAGGPSDDGPSGAVDLAQRVDWGVTAPHEGGAAPERDVSVTAALPALDPALAGPDPAPEAESATGSRDSEEDDQTVGLRRADPARAPGEGGGRAARRKAAKGGRGARSARGGRRGAASSAPAPRPGTRLEARRAARAAKDGPVVLFSRFIGEVFITFGVLMLLFVVYQLWWTNVLADRQAERAANDLTEQWEKDPKRKPGKFSAGEGFAIMYIPKLDIRVPVAQGIDKSSVLDKGMVGHYDKKAGLPTAMPWDKQGNFSVAGHRNTHGEPFRYINKLVSGDKIIVETADKYYIYEMHSRLPSTSPSNVSVITPIPPESGFKKAGRYITLTTCTPEFTSKYRLIVWGKMVEERPRSKGKPDALVG